LNSSLLSKICIIEPNKVAVVGIVDAPEVFIADTHAHTGHLFRPSHRLLLDTFGTQNFDEIFAFMVEHGHLQPAGKHADLHGPGEG
jgi:hypothetical protein